MVHDFVVIAERTTLRRIVSSKQSASFLIRHQINRQVRTLSWIVVIICCATRNVTMAAPVHRFSPLDQGDEADTTEYHPDLHHLPSTDHDDAPPKWVNPCGGVLDEESFDPDAPQLPDVEIASAAVLDVDIALNQIRTYNNEFVEKVFRMNFDEMTKTWAHVQYDWLPGRQIIPKVIGQKLPPGQFQSLEFGAILKKVYLAAQTIAVGLEQVILDRAVYGGDYLEQFASTENKLAMVLCSLQMAMLEKRVEPDRDAARQLMTNEYRDMRSASGRNMRDFVIMRDYINLLEYVQQVLHHFSSS